MATPGQLSVRDQWDGVPTRFRYWINVGMLGLIASACALCWLGQLSVAANATTMLWKLGFRSQYGGISLWFFATGAGVGCICGLFLICRGTVSALHFGLYVVQLAVVSVAADAITVFGNDVLYKMGGSVAGIVAIVVVLWGGQLFAAVLVGLSSVAERSAPVLRRLPATFAVACTGLCTARTVIFLLAPGFAIRV